MQNVDSYARIPKQERSRQSFDKAVDAAVSLLVERQSDAFTLAEVAALAGVSTGSIYCRVNSKDDLLRTAHAREMARIAEETERVFAAEPPQNEPFGDAVGRVVGQMGGLLRANAPSLRAFMLRAHQDPVIAKAGKAGHAQMAGRFRSALLARRAEINHPDPDHAVTWSGTVTYSVLARWLGLGTALDAAGEGEWEEILADLTETVTTFLSHSGRSSRR
ncbi:hypothetical protein SRB17_79650 [Streptomyces sp. RB17]|uniref:TetR/AcrR family transcriptional regulator n=1 Tax=Streptomyces sp. RB17 TaxID=2585197 RepID=UPI0012950B9B|nr:TetR/AcrR family transcriptional regulator [Streptomyces sp. RB17]MQY39937.1 hypothetical protein [Streptomyces sp. RB17]